MPLLFLPLGIAAAKKPAKNQADRILVEKAARRMTLYRGETVLNTYRISLGGEPVGAKQEQGDHKTPEGRYTIDARNPNSSYHRALHISYPGPDDRKRARQRGVAPGGAIMIHGLPNGMGDIGTTQPLIDWTDGCIAVSNAEIEEIWDKVPNGTTIEILP